MDICFTHSVEQYPELCQQPVPTTA